MSNQETVLHLRAVTADRVSARRRPGRSPRAAPGRERFPRAIAAGARDGDDLRGPVRAPVADPQSEQAIIYKKHLPAQRRRDVDRLVDRMMRRAPDAEVRLLLESILAEISDADDWNAAIRDPALFELEPLDPEQLADWERRLDAAQSAG